SPGALPGPAEPTLSQPKHAAGAGLGPQALATELALHIAPQRYDDLVLLVAQTAAVQLDPQRRAYWQAVYDAFTR
ncbi:unnamed protein product, partial [marine sediment metagenome]